jgi:hypothetical protein
MPVVLTTRPPVRVNWPVLVWETAPPSMTPKKALAFCTWRVPVTVS